MLTFIEDNLVLMLTGSTMVFFGGILYKTTKYAFISGGQFRNKQESLLIFLIAIPITGYITLLVQNFWLNITEQLSLLNMLGVLIIAGMLAINYSIKNWKFLDEKSLFFYLIGIILFLLF